MRHEAELASARSETQDALAAGERASAAHGEMAAGRAELAESRAHLVTSEALNLELTRANAALEASEGRFRAIIESATDYAIITTDLAGTVTGWNEGAHHVLGWGEDEVIGRSAALIFTPEDRAAGAPEQEIDKARDEGRASDERWHVRRDGSRFWASGELMRLVGAGGTHVGYLKILRDRTGAKEAEARLRDSEERFAAIANSIDQMIWSTQPDGYHDFYNQRWYDYTGVPPGSTDGEAWNDMFHPDDQTRAWEIWRHSLETGEP